MMAFSGPGLGEVRPQFCLSVKPGYAEFPPRCIRGPGHQGPHQASLSWGIGREEWENLNYEGIQE